MRQHVFLLFSLLFLWKSQLNDLFLQGESRLKTLKGNFCHKIPSHSQSADANPNLPHFSAVVLRPLKFTEYAERVLVEKFAGEAHLCGKKVLHEEAPGDYAQSQGIQNAPPDAEHLSSAEIVEGHPPSQL